MDTAALTAERLEERDFDTIETEWLERVDTEPTDLAYFAAVAAVLDRESQLEFGRPLLRLLDEELTARNEIDSRLEFLLAAGPSLHRPGALHEEAVGLLEAKYDDSPSLTDMFRIAGLHQAAGDIRTLRRKVERLHSLMLLDVGSLVYMEGKGVGKITEINFDLGRYKVDFERIPALTVGFKAGAKLMQPLPDGHVLRTKVEAPERLESLRDDEPSELLREVLESFGEPRTAAEIKAALEGVVSPPQWSRWWNAARKHQQVLVTSDKRQRYGWAASSDDATDALRHAFEQADLDGRLEIFTKNAPQNPDLATDMAATLADVGEEVAGGNPMRALTIWFALSRAGLAEDEGAYSPATIVANSSDRAALARGLDQKAIRDAVYSEIRRQDDDWPELLTQCALAEPEPSLVGGLAAQLGEEDPAHLEALVDKALSRPNEYPGAFIWLARAAGTDEALRQGRSARLFRQLLTVGGRRQFQPYRNALAPLLESGGTLPRLIPDFGEDEARPALEAVLRSNLEDYERAPLITALEMRFEALREEGEEGLYALRTSIERRGQEVRLLHEEEIPANRQAIQEAAALGDLRENFEYKSARQRHEYLSARLANLQGELDRVQPIDLTTVGTEEVRIGATVELDGADGRREITILGPWESDPEAGRLSYQSDLGKRLIGSRLGDEIELEDGAYTVVSVRPSTYEPD